MRVIDDAKLERLIEDLYAGNRRATARLISLVEEGSDKAVEVLRRLYSRTGHALTIGITGSPGVGKSTLVDALISHLRRTNQTVGVIAVDPTSPFSGGALLGDRVRMQEHALDEGVFIRSMATRGHLGGLSVAVPEAMRVLEASGTDVVMVETVGVGQSEVEIARQAETTVVVVAPGMGDAIQAAKAGILEIADVYCVNKADKPGADDTRRDLRQMLELGHGRDVYWTPPIIPTSAAESSGIDALWQAISHHRDHLAKDGRLGARRRDRITAEIRELATMRIRRDFDSFDDLVDLVVQRQLDPYSAADQLMDRIQKR